MQLAGMAAKVNRLVPAGARVPLAMRVLRDENLARMEVTDKHPSCGIWSGGQTMKLLLARKAWVGIVAGAALLAFGGTKVAAAGTLDLAAMFGPACSAGASPAFLAAEPQTPAPNTPDDQQPKTCRVNGNCWKPAYCSRDEGTCKGAGVCKAKPESCPDHAAAVCGCDNKTYTNECLAAAAGTSVSHKGECQR